MAIRADDVSLVQDLLLRGASRDTGDKVVLFTVLNSPHIRCNMLFSWLHCINVDSDPVGRIHSIAQLESHVARVATGARAGTRDKRAREDSCR